MEPSINIQEPPAARNILVVEDEPAMLFAYRMLFKVCRFQMDACDTFERAMELLDTQTYAAVITDLSLTQPGSQEGLHILKRIREKNLDTKVILVTGYGCDAVRNKALYFGVSRYFEKPVPPLTIFRALHELNLLIDPVS